MNNSIFKACFQKVIKGQSMQMNFQISDTPFGACQKLYCTIFVSFFLLVHSCSLDFPNVSLERLQKYNFQYNGYKRISFFLGQGGFRRCEYVFFGYHNSYMRITLLLDCTNSQQCFINSKSTAQACTKIKWVLARL